MAGPVTDMVLCLVHDDGHVAGIVNYPRGDPQVHRQLRALGHLGIGGWRAERLPVEKAAAAFLDGIGCPVCRLTMPCGCTMDAITRGRCGHGSAAAIRDAYRKAGADP